MSAHHGTRHPLFQWYLVPCALLPLHAAYADIVYYKSGDLKRGVVVEEHHDRIVLSTSEGEEALFREDVDEIFFPDPERNYLYLGNEALERRDLNTARGFFQKALQILPGFEEAQDALQHLEELQAKTGMTPFAGSGTVLLEKQWGLVLEMEEDWATVKMVLAGSLASGAGLRRQDRLVSLWGGSLRYRELHEVAEALWGPPGSAVKLTIQREVNLGSSAGLTLEMRHLGLTAAAVDPNGQAFSSGLRVGDRIVAINKQPTRYLPLDKARQSLLPAKESQVTLLVHRDLMVKRESGGLQ